MSHMCMSHVTHMNESCRTYERVMSHTCTSHVTHMNESCRTYECLNRNYRARFAAELHEGGTAFYPGAGNGSQSSRCPGRLCLMVYTLQHAATNCSTLQHTATHCNTLQHTATHCNTLQHCATHCNILQLAATHCNTLPHTATH